MTIQLDVTSELESQLNKVAKQMGLTPDTYIKRLSPPRQLEMDMATIRNTHLNDTPERCAEPML